MAKPHTIKDEPTLVLIDRPRLPSRFRDFPLEIISHILDLGQPEHPIPDEFEHYNQVRILQYREMRYKYARLRLVCRTWAYMIPPFLCRHIVLFTLLRGTLGLIDILQEHGKHVQAISADASLYDLRTDEDVETWTKRAWKIMTLCPKVHALEIHGISCLHSPTPMTDACPNLKSSVKSLMYQWYESSDLELSDMRLASAIRQIGTGLEDLNLRYWQCRPVVLEHGAPAIIPRFRIPALLPNLKSLTLYRGNPPVTHIETLISAALPDEESKNSTLRNLFLDSLDCEPIDIISHILAINNTGLNLTTLHIRLRKEYRYAEADVDIAVQILSHCPNLVDLSYLSPAPTSIFEKLPSSIRRLELALYPKRKDRLSYYEDAGAVEAFSDYLHSENGRKLERLSIICFHIYIWIVKVDWKQINLWLDVKRKIQKAAKDVSVPFFARREDCREYKPPTEIGHAHESAIQRNPWMIGEEHPIESLDPVKDLFGNYTTKSRW